MKAAAKGKPRSKRQGATAINAFKIAEFRRSIAKKGIDNLNQSGIGGVQCKENKIINRAKEARKRRTKRDVRQSAQCWTRTSAPNRLLNRPKPSGGLVRSVLPSNT